VAYIARVNKKGEPMYSRPCDACHKQLLKAGVTRVVYTIGNL
jgi:deoxycytidylate deaminase